MQSFFSRCTKSQMTTIQDYSFHRKCFCKPKSVSLQKSWRIQSYRIYCFLSSFKCITSVDFQYDHIFFGGALHITCWAGVSYGSKIIQNKLIVWDVDSTLWRLNCVGCGGTWTEECAAQAHAACSEPTWRRRSQQHFVIWWITAWYPL